MSNEVSSDVYQELSRVKPPLQDRSRQAQFAALDAFEAMLRDRPLHKVTVQEVADHAKLSITSVYARFDGKKALVLALHERVIHDALRRLVEMLDAARDGGWTLEETIAILITGAVAFSDDHSHVFTAVLSAGDEETNQRAAGFIRTASETLARQIVPMIGSPADTASRDVDYAWCNVVAMLQQRWALGGADPARYPLDPGAFIDRLIEQFMSTVAR